MSFKTDKMIERANLNENESSFSSAEETFTGEAEAERIFSRLKTKLLDINEWNDHGLVSSYAIFDERGNERADGTFEKGAFVRISLTGSGKYDWVRVHNIYEAADEFIITVKPTFDPTEEDGDKTRISHFFTDDSTNNFCLLRKNNRVALYVIGLDEKQNTGETKNAIETVRNVAVNLGTYLGVQKTEWEKFCHGFLECAAGEA